MSSCTAGGSVAATGYEVSALFTVHADRRERPELWDAHVHEMQGRFAIGFSDLEDFIGFTKFQRFQDYALVEFASDLIDYRRHARHAAGDDGASARLVTPLEGSLTLTQRRDTVEIAPGSVGMFRMDQPMAMAHASGTRALILTVPDGVITRRLADRAPLLMPRQRPLVSMLTGHLGQLAAHRDAMTRDEFVKGMEVLFHLLECVLDDSRPNRPTGYANTADRALRYVLRHSDDPDLTPAVLAAALNCSLSYLHKALETAGTTPGRLLRTVRIERARDRLRDPNPTVEEIGYRSGFRSAPTFRQNFTRHFGMTPGRMREQFRSAGTAPDPQ
ncbi:AraC family transcriptional regulator [Nocardia rhamnosiphila]|uniref:AraC family transcriptional regulator n=1 Tax=Nocardia rhamnosiphila TaxID=426716 RepID=UPI0037B52091